MSYLCYCVCLYIVVSNTYVLCFCFSLSVCPVLPVSLDSPFFIGPLVFSNVYFTCYPVLIKSTEHETISNSLKMQMLRYNLPSMVDYQGFIHISDFIFCIYMYRQTKDQLMKIVEKNICSYLSGSGQFWTGHIQ
jgi:hypothetical protein